VVVEEVEGKGKREKNGVFVVAVNFLFIFLEDIL
jgi:hypothetical protein